VQRQYYELEEARRRLAQVTASMENLLELVGARSPGPDKP
jgi:hypothetical protein